MAERTRAYEVTETAGQWVAGRRVSVGEVLVLTEREAEQELRVGSLRLSNLAKAVGRDKTAKA